MAVQTTYAATLTAAYAGQPADIGHNEIVSRIVETSGGIAPGVAVTRGTSDNEVVLATNAAAFGITVRNLSYEGAASTAALTYAATETVPVMLSGWIYLNIPTASANGTGLFFADGTGVIDAGTASTNQTQLPGCTLEQTTSAANTVALCRVNFITAQS